MAAIVAFDYSGWRARYPEFSNVPQETALQYFNEAQIYHRNDGTIGPSAANVQDMLIKMVMAHLAQLYAPDVNGQPASTIVGRIASASEGSVSVSSEMAGPDKAAFWYQTKYGVSYWNASKQYRLMRYKRGHVRPANPFPYTGFGRWGGGW